MESPECPLPALNTALFPAGTSVRTASGQSSVCPDPATLTSVDDVDLWLLLVEADLLECPTGRRGWDTAYEVVAGAVGVAAVATVVSFLFQFAPGSGFTPGMFVANAVTLTLTAAVGSYVERKKGSGEADRRSALLAVKSA